jgi:hypothetical protein
MRRGWRLGWTRTTGFSSRYALLAAALLLVSTTAARAQALTPPAGGPRPAAPFALIPAVPSTEPSELDVLRAGIRSEIRPTHWLKGGAIGATVLGVLTGVLVAGLCGESETVDSCVLPTIGGIVLGGALGFTTGALIGGQFPKGPPGGAEP